MVGLLPGTAGAVTALAPAEGSSNSSTPRFTWRLGPGEHSSTLELSPNPAPGEGGGFTDDMAKRTFSLADTQTSFVVGNSAPLSPGVWFWRVGATGPDFDTRLSVIRRFVVRDEPIRLLSLKLTSFRCIRDLSLEFSYADNSSGQPARYRLEFRRTRRGRRVASIAGRADEGRLFTTRRVPRRLRAGRRYYVRLSLRDRGHHVDRSRFRRLRIGRC